MTTDMKTAIQKAGITLPTNQRIWMWLKDHPKSTGAQIAATLNEPDNNVATLCKDMYERGMVTREFEERRGKAGRGWTLRMVTLYTVNPKMQTYELWPKPVKKPAPPSVQKKELPEPKQEAKAIAPEPEPPQPTWTPETFVQTITLRQARDLHNYLNEIFNPKEK